MKFKPGKYTIQFVGIGGEYVVGNIPRELFDYFRENGLSVNSFAYDSDYFDDNEIPEEVLGNIGCGEWHEIDNLFHEYGMESGNFILCDESDDELLNIEIDDIGDYDIDGDNEEFFLRDIDDGATVFFGQQWDKGLLYSAEFVATEEFDTADLTVFSYDIEGVNLYKHVMFKGNILEDDGKAPDTRDKGSEMAFYASIDSKIVKYAEESDYDVEEEE